MSSLFSQLITKMAAEEHQFPLNFPGRADQIRYVHKFLVKKWGESAGTASPSTMAGIQRELFHVRKKQKVTHSAYHAIPSMPVNLSDEDRLDISGQFHTAKRYWNCTFTQLVQVNCLLKGTPPISSPCQVPQEPIHVLDPSNYATGSPSRQACFDEMMPGASSLNELLEKKWSSMDEAVQDIRIFCGMCKTINQTLINDPRIQSGSKKKVLCCKEGASESSFSCPFTVTVRKRGNTFEIDKLVSCFDRTNCTSSYVPRSKELLRHNSFSASLSSTYGRIRPKIAHENAKSVGLSATYFKARRATVAYREGSQESWEKSFGKIHNFLQLAVKMNPGSFGGAVCVPDSKEFYSAGWVCGPLASVVRKIGIDVAGLDAEYFPTNGFKYRILNLSTRVPINDLSNHQMMNVRLGCTIPPAEDTMEYLDFAEICNMNEDLKWFLNRKDMCIFSDRFPGIKTTIEEHFSESFHAYCARHIMMNGYANSNAQKGSMDTSFWKYRNFFPMSKEQEELQSLSNKHSGFATYVVNEGQDRWQIAHIVHKHNASLFGNQTSNLVEQVHGADRNSGMRNSHPLDFLMHVIEQQQTYIRRMKRAIQHIPENQLLVPLAELKKEEMFKLVPFYTVKDGNGENEFYVSYQHKTRGAQERSTKLIDLNKPWKVHGACNFAHQHKMPCQHYWAALLNKPKEEQLKLLGCKNNEEMYEKLFHRSYLMKNVRSALEGVEVCIPCIDDVPHDRETKPPPDCLHMKHGKRKLDGRIPSQGEL